MADDWGAGQIEVADRIQHLVAHELVVEAQAVLVEDGLAVDHDGVVQRAAAGEAHGAHLLDVLRQARSEEHTSELQSLMRISYAVFCLKKKKNVISKHRK